MNVKIVMEGHGRGKVFIDGEPLSGVRSIKLSAEVDTANVVTLELMPKKIEVEGEFDVTTIESVAREIVKGGG